MAEDKKKADEKKKPEEKKEAPKAPTNINPYSAMSNALSGGIQRGASALGRGMAAELGFRGEPEQGGPTRDQIQTGPIPSRETVQGVAASRGGPPAPGAGTAVSRQAQEDVQKAQAAAIAARDAHGTNARTSSDINNAEGRATSLYGEVPGTDARVSAAVIPGSGTVLGQTEQLAPRVRGTEGASWTTKPMGRGDENNPAYAKIREEAAAAFPGAVGGRGRGGFAQGAAELQDTRPFSERLRTMPREAIDLKRQGTQAPSGSMYSGVFAHNTSNTFTPSGVEAAADRQAYIDQRVAQEQQREIAAAQAEAEVASQGYKTRMAEMDPTTLARIEAQGKYGGEYIKQAGEAQTNERIYQIIQPLLLAHAKETDQGKRDALLQQIRAIIATFGRTAPTQSNPGFMMGDFSSMVPGGAAAGAQK